MKIPNSYQTKRTTNERQVKKKIIKTEPKLYLPFFPNQKDKEIYIDSAIKKLLSHSTLLDNELKQLMDILYQNNSETKKHFSFNFLTRLQKIIKNKVVFLPELNNFNNISNIFLNLSIKEEKTYISNLIIELSGLIKYNDSYLYKKIEKKNNRFKTYSFWKKLIEQTFINSLNEQTTKLINKENKKKKSQNNIPKEESKPFWKIINTISDLTNNLGIKEENTHKEKDSNDIFELTGYS